MQCVYAKNLLILRVKKKKTRFRRQLHVVRLLLHHVSLTAKLAVRIHKFDKKSQGPNIV